MGEFGESRDGVGKMAFWGTKAAIALKRSLSNGTIADLTIGAGTGTIARTTTARPTIARCILLAHAIARSDHCSRG